MASSHASVLGVDSDQELFDLYDQMVGNVDLHAVLRHVTEVVRQSLHAERATIYLVIKESQELESAAVLGNVSRMIRVPIKDTSLAGFCAREQRAFLVPDAYGDLGAVDAKLVFDRSWDEENEFRTHDVMCAPASFQGEVRGVVQVINSKSGTPFDTADLKRLKQVSRLVGYALYHAQLYDELATLKCLKKEKAEFMRIMVHELKSPVAASKMLVSALRYAVPGNEKVVEVVGKVGGRMDQLLSMVEDILHLSRVQAGEPLSDITVFDAVAEVRQGCGMYLEQAEAKGLALVLDFPDEQMPIRFDVSGFKMVLSNLVSNAVKYTQEGSVHVSLNRSEDTACLTVVDTGMGIPEADVPKLFQEFYRASNARASDINGTGVGLAGVKELVERFGGHIALTSVEGSGSTFSVRIPISDEDIQAPKGEGCGQ
ncbi:MAG: GAF domain-containing sensor histidine kinase [Lentisphaeria bacterium]|nr:GAF domain-containing sensor histidine kinase [Lentisphaeria bacterium]